MPEFSTNGSAWQVDPLRAGMSIHNTWYLRFDNRFPGGYR
jgi:hypothetical protein